MNTNNAPTRATATPEQLANGDYEVDGVMGGNGRRPEDIIASMRACCVCFAITLLLLCGVAAAALAQSLL